MDATELSHAKQSDSERLERSLLLLRESEARFRAVFDHAAVGIALIGLDGRVLETNAALQRLLGYTDDELSGHLFHDLAPPEDTVTYAHPIA